MTFRIIKANGDVIVHGPVSLGTLPPGKPVGANIGVGGLGHHEGPMGAQTEGICLDPIDESLAHALVEYLKSLTVTQGRQAGHRLQVLPWQKDFVLGAFEKKTRSAALSVARGNGKTTLVAGIAAAALDGPLMVPRGEVVIVASSFEQARIAFEHVIAFMGPKLADKDQWRVWDTAQQARIENRETGARVRCIGSDPKRAHGLAPVLVLADEPAQWTANTSEQMLAALKTAAGKQPDSRFIALGTRPADDSHWFAKMLIGGKGTGFKDSYKRKNNGADDVHHYTQCHAATPEDNKNSRVTWTKANPSLNHFPDLEIALRDEWNDAQRDSALLPAFNALRLNLGTAETEAAVLLEADTWKNLEAMPTGEAVGPMVWGIDLGATAAQSAITAYWPETGRLECVSCFPNQPSLAERGLKDGVGSLYIECEKRGELLTLGEFTSDVGALLRECLERFGQPDLIVADRWRGGELKEALGKASVPMTDLELRGMGYKDGATDVRGFRKACLDGRVSPPKSLLLRSAMAEARVATDPAGNQKLAKGSQGGRRLRARDDAAAATILAVSAGTRVWPNTVENTSLPEAVIGGFI